MPGIYLRECLIDNVGPMTSFDVSLGFNNAGNPKPVILVGKNGTGKTIVLAYILDALSELAKRRFTDVVVGQQRVESPYIKSTSSADCRSLCGKSVCLLEFSDLDKQFSYIEQVGEIDRADYSSRLGTRFRAVHSWPAPNAGPKMVTGGLNADRVFLRFGHSLLLSVVTARISSLAKSGRSKGRTGIRRVQKDAWRATKTTGC